MIVLSVTNCPLQLRGDLTKWMIEIDVGVYVGNLSARVREKLWERVTSNIRTGKAIMVYSSNNEQGFQILTHNTDWTPVLSEGLCLMQKPNEESVSRVGMIPREVCKAEKFLLSKRHNTDLKKDYVIWEMQTTGLECKSDEIIEIGMLKIEGNKIAKEFQQYILPRKNISVQISETTGISQELLEEKGVSIKRAMEDAALFLRNNTVVGYNFDFSLEFINAVCERENIENIIYRSKDIMRILKRKTDFEDYCLENVATMCNIAYSGKCGALEKCRVVYGIISKLNLF